MTERPRILLGQLAANGDCLYATAVARQIKYDWPDCHLTWAIGSLCRSVIRGNPYVDDVWEVPVESRAAVTEAWWRFEKEARQRHAQGDFDKIYLTQIHPGNMGNFDGTVRASIFRGYPGPITVPITPVVRLDRGEVDHAAEFARMHRLTERRHVVLFECGPQSAQSFVNAGYAIDVARRIVRDVSDTCVLISSPGRVETGHEAIIDASGLTFRENAAISHYCDLLIGCSSGITWLCTSDAAKPLPTIQILSRKAGPYGAVAHDLEHWGLSSEHVIEMRDCPAEQTGRCARALLEQGVGAARREFNEPLELRFDLYCQILLPYLARGDVSAVARSLRLVIARYGLRPQLVTALASTGMTGARQLLTRHVTGQATR